MESREWELDKDQWRNGPCTLTRYSIRSIVYEHAPCITLWHLEREDDHPGQAWFTNDTVRLIFTYVDDELEAWHRMARSITTLTQGWGVGMNNRKKQLREYQRQTMKA